MPDVKQKVGGEEAEVAGAAHSLENLAVRRERRQADL